MIDAQTAFEEEYQADWNDPGMRHEREVWERAWRVAESKFYPLLAAQVAEEHLSLNPCNLDCAQGRNCTCVPQRSTAAAA